MPERAKHVHTIYCMIYCTVENVAEGEKIARHLLDKQLIACCNIIPGLISIYRWEGNIEKSEEALLLIKSTCDKYPEIERAILEQHSYDVPEILSVPIREGSNAYLEWMQQNVTG